MKARRRQRLLRRLVFGLAVAAIAAPAAQARTSSWYLGEGVLNGLPKTMNQRQVEQLAFHEGTRVPTASTTLSSQQLAQALANARRPAIPSERHFALEAKRQSTIVNQHLLDLEAMQPSTVKRHAFDPEAFAEKKDQGPTQSTISVDHKADLVTPSDLPANVVAGDGGFSWGDAGIGAGSVLALLAIAAGAAGATRSRRGAQAA